MNNNSLKLNTIYHINLLWKKKGWILVIAAVFGFLGLGVSFLIKPLYEIDSIIQPGKFLVENRSGNFIQTLVEEPQQIAKAVNHKAYDILVAEQIGIDVSNIPSIGAEDLKNTFLTRIWLKTANITFGKKILDSLIAVISKDIDQKVEIELKNIDSLIEDDEIDKARREKEIEILRQKLKISQKRINEIQEEMNSVKGKIESLESEQMEIISKKNRSETETLGLLLYSNEVQQSIMFYDIINEKLMLEKLNEADIRSDIEVEIAEIESLKNHIDNLNKIKGRFDYTRIIKIPTSSLHPVTPSRYLVILIAICVGLVFSIGLVFLIDLIRSDRIQ